jgi:hypothetical protein
MHKPSDDPLIDPETMYREPTPPGPVLSPEELRAILDESTVGDAIDPDHYKVGGIETIDYMKAKSTPEEFEGYLRLSSLKYLSRVGHKHGDHDAARAEEYRKARWYIDRLIREIDP